MKGKHIVLIILIAVVGFVVLCAVALVKESVVEFQVGETEEKMEAALVKNDFSTAMSMAKILDEKQSYSYEKVNVPRVANAHMGWLISEGDFALARQIAMENKIPDAYYSQIVPNLLSIYNKYGSKTTVEVLATCEMPIRGKHWGTMYFSDDDAFDNGKWKNFNVQHNNYVERLMEFMKLKDDSELAKVSIFLSANYPGGENDVKKIKAKFGLK